MKKSFIGLVHDLYPDFFQLVYEIWVLFIYEYGHSFYSLHAG